MDPVSGGRPDEFRRDGREHVLQEHEKRDQPFRYTGREWDEATGLTHYRARAYDPATGRFLQEDPIWFLAGPHRWVHVLR